MTARNVKNTTETSQWDQDRAMSEAEHWLVQLSNTGDAGHSGKKAAFAEWRLKDARNAEAYKRARQLWAQSGVMLEDLDQDPDLQAMLTVARQPATTTRWRRPLPVAACLAAVAVAVVLILNLPHWPAATKDIYHTATGERRAFTLADGSHVLLDAATRIEVEYSEDSRSLVLADGQARFTVTHDIERPFVVDTANGSVTVIGTVFDVRRDTSGSVVTLLEGAVEVKNTDSDLPARAVLQPGQQVALLPGGEISDPIAVNVELAGEWTNGRLVFKNAPLAEVVQTLNRHTAHKVVLGYGLEGYALHGTFNADDPNAVIEAITTLFPIKVVEEKNTLLLARDSTRD